MIVGTEYLYGIKYNLNQNLNQLLSMYLDESNLVVMDVYFNIY